MVELPGSKFSTRSGANYKFDFNLALSHKTTA
jgi:hypothetical protein